MSRKLILASTMTMMLAGADAAALGLGGLERQSVLNQPFVGAIELHDVKADELDAIKVSIASPEAFEQAGIERYYYLTKLKFTPEVSPQGKTLIRVSSPEPVREPYMNFLVQVVWPAGQLVREYTVLLDPPLFDSRRAAPVAAPSATSVSDAVSGRSASARRPAGVAAPAGALSPPGEGFPLQVGPVRSGATLWSLSNRHRPPGATTKQMAMALHRNNPHAFIRGDINRLRVGETLVVPTRAELLALDPAEAASDYAAALRGRPTRRGPVTEVPPRASDSHLRIMGAQPSLASQAAPAPGEGAQTQAPAQAGEPEMQQDVLLALETSESTRQETVELRDRIKELESQLAEIQTLLQLRNAELARMQGAQSQDLPGVLGEPPIETPPPAMGATEEMPGEPAPEMAEGPLAAAPEAAQEETPAEELAGPLEPPVGSEPVVAQVPEQESAPQETTPPAELASAEAAPPEPALAEPLPAESLSVSEGPEPPGELIPVPTPAPPPEAEPEPAPEAEPEPAPETKPAPSASSTAPATESKPSLASGTTTEAASTWHSLLLPLAGIAAVVALGILVFSWLALRRRRRDDAKEIGVDLDVIDQAAASSRGPDSTAHRADAAGPHTEQVPAPTSDREGVGSDSAPASMSSLTSFDAETDEADVLSEADIYIAYGRHTEAQQLLLKELQRAPDRLDIKLKLAEAYAGTRNLQALDQLMGEIEGAGGATAHPGQWQRLQEFRSRLQAGSGGSEGRDTGDRGGAIRPSAGAAALGAGGLAGGALADSMGLGDEDSFSLDIGDIQRSSGDAPQDEAGLDDTPLLEDLDDEEPLTLNDDALADILDDVGTPDEDLAQRSRPAADRTGTMPPGAPDAAPDELTDAEVGLEDPGLVLTLDDSDVEVVDDLDSIFDSTAGDEPTLRRDELDGGRPSGDEAPAPTPPLPAGADSSDAGLSLDQESVPTDMLSSQWQMDSGIWDETATKLDLARAYIEMDDSQAAREILEEVIAEGRDDQRSEAQVLLEKLV